jgi:hypothetical protein
VLLPSNFATSFSTEKGSIEQCLKSRQKDFNGRTRHYYRPTEKGNAPSGVAHIRIGQSSTRHRPSLWNSTYLTTHWLLDLKRSLAKHGVAMPHIERIAHSHGAHHEDIVNEYSQTGLTDQAAHDRALERLGGTENLKQAAIESTISRSWLSRHPISTYCILPIAVFIIGSMELIFLAASVMRGTGNPTVITEKHFRWLGLWSVILRWTPISGHWGASLSYGGGLLEMCISLGLRNQGFRCVY